jgi:hypothetical protein
MKKKKKNRKMIPRKTRTETGTELKPRKFQCSL